MRIFYNTQRFFLFSLSLFVFIGIQSQSISDFIRIDQFGYTPNSLKTAVIRSPQVGDDNGASFSPGAQYEVIDESTGKSVYTASPVLFDSGSTDVASGDKIWWLDFSSVATCGRYYIKDGENNLRSNSFTIAYDVYNEVLKHAVRMFYYQRAGFAKEEQYAGIDWADAASHIGANQDKDCRLYNKKNDLTTSRDLHGGWYDAGDYNKYTTWTCNYVESLLLSYLENPNVWTDNYNIPESGNGIPDILDEVKWGMDWLLRMQEEDGSVLCVVGLSHASPPSAATGQSLYGPATTMASFSAAKAFILGYKVYNLIGMTDYAETLKNAALKAWAWAEANPDVIFNNNSADNGSSGVGAGNQEVDGDYNRQAIRITAALYLYEEMADDYYREIFEESYEELPLIAWGSFVQQYWGADQLMFLHALTVDGISESVKTKIKDALLKGFNGSKDYIGKIGKDGYRSFIKDYNWGSNKYKADYGMTFWSIAEKSIIEDMNETLVYAAEDYIHYIHGVNPLGLVYLTNMNKYGASKSLTEIYHTWFASTSAKWDKVTATTPGPAPGYLSGGPNSNFTWDGCCPDNCGSSSNNKLCTSDEIPIGQPAAKMYKDFNTSWPLNSWEITEPSCGYQVAYIRLLSKFAADITNSDISDIQVSYESSPEIYPNPAKDIIYVQSNGTVLSLRLYDSQMRLLKASENNTQLNISSFDSGLYFIQIETKNKIYTEKLIIR